MALLGAHMSIAGGYYKAVERAAEAGCDVVQVFTKNNNQWRAKPITDEDVERFRAALEETGIGHTLSHDSYLINLGSPDDAMWKKSREAFIVELERAAALRIPYVVMHPGSFTESSEEAGIARIVAAFDNVHKATKQLNVGCLLETTAGQGSNLGWRFEQLAAILSGVADSSWLGVCVDTCHVFAAGYPLAPRKAYQATFDEFDRVVGLDRIRAFHVNDSKRELGSRVDRHAHIGEGALGLEPFRLLVNDERFADIPMYLETPKGERDGEDLDRMNLATLRGLVGRKRVPK